MFVGQHLGTIKEFYQGILYHSRLLFKHFKVWHPSMQAGKFLLLPSLFYFKNQARKILRLHYCQQKPITFHLVYSLSGMV